MKRLSLSIFTLISYFISAQAPLVPFYQETSEWSTNQRTKATVCSNGTFPDDIYTFYKKIGDTVISNIVYKTLEVTNQIHYYSGSTTCPKGGTIKRFFRDINNFIIEFNILKNKPDTLFYLTGTTLKNSAKFSNNSSFYKITQIDSVTIDSAKKRRFKFVDKNNGPYFYLIDGIGFTSSGPIPTSNPEKDCVMEGAINLQCFKFKNNYYSHTKDCNNSSMTILPSSEMCSSILATELTENLVNNSVKYINETKELKANFLPDEIILYDINGVKVMSILNSSLMLVKDLKTGLYFANVYFDKHRITYKLLVE